MFPTIAAATGLAVLAQAAEGRRPAASTIVGGAVVAVTLSLGARNRPELSNKFAALILITSLMVNGATLSRSLTTYIRRDQSA